MLILYPLGAFILCLEITVLGYRWRIVLIVVDNAWWLGKLKLINWVSHWIWWLVQYNTKMCIDWLNLYMIIVSTHCIVWEEMGDVLHSFLEDGWWTSKEDFVWHWYSTTMCIKYGLWKCLNWFDIALKCISLSIVKYRSISMLYWYSTKMCSLREVRKWFMCY